MIKRRLVYKKTINDYTPEKLNEYPYIMTAKDICDYLGCSKAYVSYLKRCHERCFLKNLGIDRTLIKKRGFAYIMAYELRDKNFFYRFDELYKSE